jgi:hypothetical protein
VREVVDDGADARTSQVRGEREVGSDEKGEQRPERVIAVDVERRGGDGDGEAL